VSDDLLIAAIVVGSDGGEFESVEGTLAGQRFAPVGWASAAFAERVGDTDENGHEDIVAKSVVIVKVFVAEAEAEDALLEEGDERMLDALGIAMIGEAGGELFKQAELGFDFTQQKGTGIRGDATAVEIGENIA